ncbi:hypothetical protein F2Q70_00026037 [Brassica cretica]|uniref:Uncharacterized protein n=1 Tax=Brassica cretica TaxID=69181 RepID=A0A8S9LFZ8_BRACR|nr:hypothetical protein F2Q70_00026037 [Brassica cretica]
MLKCDAFYLRCHESYTIYQLLSSYKVHTIMLHQTLTTREDNHRSAIWFAMYPQNSCPVPLIDETTFSHDLLKEDVYQELKDISESTHARIRMQQRSIENLQHRMNASEVARERLKNQLTRGDEAIRNFICTWFQISKD